MARKSDVWIDPYRFRVADQHFANVVLLMHFDGADGGTVFTDVKGHTITTTGVMTTSNEQSLSGGTSLKSGGNAANRLRSGSTDFNLPGDFTVEFFVYDTGILYDFIESGYSEVGGAGSYMIRLNLTAGKVTLWSGGSNALTADTPLLNNNAWNHIALTSLSGVWRMWINGVVGAQGGVTSFTPTQNPDKGYIRTVGAFASAGVYFEELRITKGVCRYTGSFSVPLAPFPDE